MLPTLGRIVLYTLTEDDAHAIDDPNDRAFRHVGTHTPVRPGQTYPAVVVALPDPITVNLQVMLDGHGIYWATSRVEGTEPGTWAWPPRVEA